MGGATRFDPDEGPPADPAAGWDPDRWWTFGQAADLAGVPHRTLADWAGSGRIQVRTAWREGAEIRLVRAGDVAALAPDARERAQERSADLESRAVYTGPRRSGLGVTGGSGTGGDLPEPRIGPADPESGSWQREVEREIERLRSELDDVREQRDQAQALLFAVRESQRPQDVGDVISRPAPAVPHAPAGHRPAATGPGRPTWLAVATAAAAALIIGSLVGRFTAPDSASVASAKERDIAGGPPITGTMALADSTDVPLPPLGFEPPAEVAVSQADGVQADGVQADGGQADGGQVAAQQADVRQAGALAPDAVSAEEASAPVEANRVDGLRFSLPASFRTIVAGSEAAFVDGPPCALSSAVDADTDVRVALGPCFGPLTQDGGAIAATHRLKGTPCCKHHAFVERMTGAVGDVDARTPLLEEAAQSEREGLVPALLILRAERSATRFVSAAIGGWIAAGLDGEQGQSAHSWTILSREEPLALSLTSWIVTGEPEATRRFRIVVELRGSGEGDLLRSFEWLED